MALPPKVGELTDEDANNEDTRVSAAFNFARFVEIQRSEDGDKGDDKDNLPLSYVSPQKEQKSVN